MSPMRLTGRLALCAALAGCGGASAPIVDAQVVDAQVVDLGATLDVPSSASDALASTDTAAPSDVPAAPDAPAAQDVPAMAGPYPEGPYGSREGTVLANLEWEGYVNATGEQRSTALMFGPTSLQDLRGDGRGYALIHLAEFL